MEENEAADVIRARRRSSEKREASFGNEGDVGIMRWTE